MKFINAVQKYDVVMFNWLVNVRFYLILTRLCRYISKTGDGHLYLILIAMLYCYGGIQNGLLQTLLLAFGCERPIYFVLKNSFKRHRPSAAIKNFHSVIIPSDQFSFPSGHTSAAFMVATIVAYYYPQLMLVVFSWAGLVGFSRVVLGVHFPTDILMGIVLGLSGAAISLLVIR